MTFYLSEWFLAALTFDAKGNDPVCALDHRFKDQFFFA